MRILLIDFGNTDTTKRLIEKLEKTKKHKVVVDVYPIFKNDTVKNINGDEYDALVLGGSKNKISVKNLQANYPSNAEKNPLYEAYDIIDMFDSKPVLGIGYGCQVLCTKCGCTLKELDSPNRTRTQEVTFDRRYGLQDSLKTRTSECVFNNRYGVDKLGKDTKIVAWYSTTTGDDKSGAGFRFRKKEHYGYMFRLVGSASVGDELLSKFISRLPRS